MTNQILRSLVLALISTGALAATCPQNLYYKNGNYLKSGANFYYSNGNYLVSGTSLYHANGNYFKSGANYYYPTGSYLKSGTNLYYPNGNYIKSGSNFYYQNGNHLQSGANFYYENGNYARSGTTLYNPDGTQSAFPVSLSSSIGSYGDIRVHITATSADYTYRLHNLFTDANVTLHNFSPLEPQFDLRIGNGNPNQFIRLTVDASTGVTACELDDGIAPNPEFTIQSGPATVKVKVNPGYDVHQVRDALEKALQGLR